MNKKVAVLQSNYIPWKGYFDIIGKVDLFIFHDDLQYTKNDWRNRNKIKSPNGLIWLTIPCGISEKRLICEVELKDKSWQKVHWEKIQSNYKKAPFFNHYKDFFEDFYLNKKWDYLSDLNQFLIKYISKNFLFLKTEFSDSREYDLKLKKADRLRELLLKVNANIYYSGPSAKDYLSEDFLMQKNIETKWMEYNNYKEYKQLFGSFENNVSIIDLLFNVGPESINFIQS